MLLILNTKKMGFPVFKEFNPKQKGELWIKTSHRFFPWEEKNQEGDNLPGCL